MRTIHWRRVFACLALVAMTSTGCITFQEQTMSYEHDAVRDRLRVYTTYVGVHGDGLFDDSNSATGGLTRSEQDELLAVAAGERIYFFDNWYQVIDLGELRGQLAMPVRPFVARADRAADAARRQAWAGLVANVTISNGPFYRDAQGRLCAAQRMTVMNVASVLKTLNAALRLHAEALAADDPERSRDAVSVEEWIAFDGNQLTLQYPRDSDNPLLAWPGPGGLQDRIVTRVYGQPDGPRVTVTGSLATRYVPNAVDFVRERIGLAPHFDPKVDADQFFTQAPPHRPLRRKP